MCTWLWYPSVYNTLRQFAYNIIRFCFVFYLVFITSLDVLETGCTGSCMCSSETWWRHQMEIFFALLALCVENSPVTDEFTKASDAEFWCFLWSAPWINGWVNSSATGDLRRHRAHYDVIVMIRQYLVAWTKIFCWPNFQTQLIFQISL